MVEVASASAKINAGEFEELTSDNVIDLQIVRWARWFRSLPPAEQRAVLFRGRIAGYPSSLVAFKRPLRARSAGAAVPGLEPPGLTVSTNFDVGEAAAFLALLDPDAKFFSFQTFDDNKARKDGKLARIIHKPLSECQAELARLNSEGAGIFVTVNETDGKGRKSENITRGRTIWQEDDNGWTSAFPLEPSIVVETSPGKFHRYWLVNGLSKEEHATVMDRMVKSFCSDKNAKDFARVMRLPGSWHRKGEPLLVKVTSAPGTVYSRDEILAAFPPVPREVHKPQPMRTFLVSEEQERARYRAALLHIPADDRETWVTVGMALKQEYGDPGRELWDEWSKGSEKYDQWDQERVWRSFKGNGVGAGSLFHIAKLNGYRPERRTGGKNKRGYAPASPSMKPRNLAARPAPEPARAPGNSATAHAEPDNDADEAAPLHSETAIAERLIAEHLGDLRYVAELGQWLVWDGSCWKPDRKGYAFSRARKYCVEAAAKVNEEAVAAMIETRANRISPTAMKFMRSLTSARSRAAIDKLAREDGRLLILPEELDRDPWLLNTPDGVIELKNEGKMREHRASDFMTQMTSVSPDANCPTPEWTKYLKRVTSEDAGKITYLQRSAGYFCTGDIGKESLWFLYGPGGNGKGVYTTTLARILLDYHCTAPVEILLEAPFERHPADLARLRGKRLVTFNETDEDKRWSEAKIKGITGGDPINCRHMRQNPFEYLPQFKPLISGNHKPALRSVNEAIKRRFRLVPFDVVIPKDERDEDLKRDKLRPEFPGILAWMIQGCLDMLKDGLDPPDAVTEATEDYLSSEDALANWFADRCEPDLLGFEGSEDLFDDWRQWVARNGVHSNIGSKALIQKLLERREWGLKRYQEKTGARRRGLMGLSFNYDVKAEREEDRKAKMGAKERAKVYYKPENDKAKA